MLDGRRARFDDETALGKRRLDLVRLDRAAAVLVVLVKEVVEASMNVHTAMNS